MTFGKARIPLQLHLWYKELFIRCFLGNTCRTFLEAKANNSNIIKNNSIFVLNYSRHHIFQDRNSRHKRHKDKISELIILFEEGTKQKKGNCTSQTVRLTVICATLSRIRTWHLTNPWHAFTSSPSQRLVTSICSFLFLFGCCCFFI